MSSETLRLVDRRSKDGDRPIRRADYVLESRDGDWVAVEVKFGESDLDKAADSVHRLADRVARRPKALLVVTGTSFAHTRGAGLHIVPLGVLGP